MTLPPRFAYRNGGGGVGRDIGRDIVDPQLFVEEVSLASLAARFGTPLYVYSKSALTDAYAAYADALHARIADGQALICYAIKANSNLAILDLFARAGAGFDIVSGGELERVLAAGGRPERIVFSGVGKTGDELRRALDVGIACFNVESISEARQLDAVARAAHRRAPVSLRINPDVDARTHPYIATGLKESKFGIAYAEALQTFRTVASLSGIEIVGIDCHIGSQLLDVEPLMDALEKLLTLVDALDAEGIRLQHIDLGGGIGIRYRESDATVDIGAYLQRVVARIDAWEAGRAGGSRIKLLFEPGRSLVGNAGALVTRVLVLKPGETKNFAVVDAAMNDLMRPAMYDAWHAFVPVVPRDAASAVSWEIVGPICESGDWLAHDRVVALGEGDLLACLSAGAYAMAMASNYNTRPRAAEVLVDGETVHLIRERETVAGLFAGERLAG